MKKIFGILVVFVVGIFVTGNTNQVFAIESCNVTMPGEIGGPFTKGDSSNLIKFNLSNLGLNKTYKLTFRLNSDPIYVKRLTVNKPSDSSGKIVFSTSDSKAFEKQGSWQISLSGGGLSTECSLGTYTVSGATCSGFSVYQKGRDDSEDEDGICYGGDNGGCLDTNHDVWIISKVVSGVNNRPFTGKIIQDLKPGLSKQGSSPDGILEKNHGELDENDYIVNIIEDSIPNIELCSYAFDISLSCDDVEDSCAEVASPTTIGPDTFSLCHQIPEGQKEQYDECLKCTEGTEENEGNAGVWTAIGCIKRDPVAIIEKLVTVGLGIGGGFALITFLAAGFIYSTSQGSPEKVKNAKEMMTASIVGIVFVIFSVTMLQFIGWSILKIPGFGG